MKPDKMESDINICDSKIYTVWEEWIFINLCLRGKVRSLYLNDVVFFLSLKPLCAELENVMTPCWLLAQISINKIFRGTDQFSIVG